MSISSLLNVSYLNVDRIYQLKPATDKMIQLDTKQMFHNTYIFKLIFKFHLCTFWSAD